MKSCSNSRRKLCRVALFLVVVVLASQTEAKIIRLRNQLIPTKPAGAAQRARLAAARPQVFGLYLIQVRGALSADARAQLAALGIDLLHYVPEDSYVARCRNVRLDELQALPFVEWVGEYRPEYKVHRDVQTAARAALVKDLRITLLLAPRITPAEIAGARANFTRVQQSSTLRSGTILRGTLNAARLDSLARSETVLWIEPARDMKLSDEVASKIVAGDGGPGQLLTQSLGYDGSGVAVAVADSGLNNGDAATMHPDLLGRTPAFFYYGQLTDAADEHSHGTHVAGIVAGNGATGEKDENGALYGLGVAPGASIIAQRIFDAVGGFEAPPSYEKLTRDATRAGAVIGSNSWGDDTQGRYDVSAMEFDDLVRDADALTPGDQPYILEFSAGNAGPGPQTIGTPAVAKNVLATGASENDRPDMIIYSDGIDVMADFSSRGPCEDGRIKPDVVAPGTWISSLQSASASDQFAWSPIDSYYQYQGGTSQAGPHASGAAAVFVQFYRQTHTNATPSPALVKAALINSAIDMDDSSGTGPIPNMDEGWGRLDLTALLDPALNFNFLDQTVLLTNSQVFERRMVVAGADEPLKITLAYTDVPGLPAAIPALVNNLDLEVVAPDGTLYRGNQFDQGESIPNPPGFDTINNVKAVHLATPLPGEYLVRVRARHVAEDARADTPAVDQDFALVTSAVLATPGVGTVTLDRTTYTAPSQIKVTVIDTDLAGQPSTGVQVRSLTEPAGETVSLTAAGSSGVFTGAVATATGRAATDGRLQIANNDSIEAVYFDASANVERVASARADLVAPVLSGVSITNSFGQAIVTWASDEPATSIVRYGTNASASGLIFAVTNRALDTAHSMSLSGLVPGRTYYAAVVSADAAGNVATNNNNGAFYPFTLPPGATLLLVDEYQDPFFGAPPLSGYTDALNAVGLSYDVWDASVRGAPTLDTLRPYQAVIWRVPELTGAWTAAEQLAISNYLAGGGGFLVASMEVLSRLEENGATDFIHNVLQVQSYVPDPDSTGATEVLGAPAAAIGAGLDMMMDYSVYDNLWGGLAGPDLSDTITPTAAATAVLQNDFGDNVGLRWPGAGQKAPGRLVLLSFPLDAAPMNGGVNDRVNLLRNILAFLAPAASSSGTLSLDSSAYTLPSLVTAQVGDADLAGQGSLTVTASSTSDPSGLTVTLVETPQLGVFSGSFTLVSAANPATSGKLRAQDADTITVKYVDASAARTVTASAVVDTNAPSILNVMAEPDYVQATISWDTSEPADALVQFGESPLLGRTAYSGAPGTTHSVQLNGLAPDRTYYYQVVSRDLAGNTRTDHGPGNSYTFHTLLPLLAPWADNLDSGATNWSTFSSSDAQTEWTLGVPANGLESSAHSPPNAWGSNLSGKPIDYAETFLISPAIYLTNGNVATLTFWHSYDFSDQTGYDIEYGEVQIVTNNSGSVIPLADFSDVSGGWEQAQIDLTPYMGNVVYLVWYYLAFSFDSLPRPGWLVDDVAITVDTVQPGTVQISNNLSQASYVLSGPTFLKGNGMGTTLTNAPPGQYILEFADVPYYLPPAPQTNTLAPGGLIAFRGDYTFPDVNHNGMSDLWEQTNFGAVSVSRTAQTDTDGDGMTDYAEFIAGTDPNNAQSKLTVSARIQTGGAVNLSWPAASGRDYWIQVSTNGAVWSPYASPMRASTTAPMDYRITPGSGAGPALFRILVAP